MLRRILITWAILPLVLLQGSAIADPPVNNSPKKEYQSSSLKELISLAFVLGDRIFLIFQGTFLAQLMLRLTHTAPVNG
jgi:hypothetical protein